MNPLVEAIAAKVEEQMERTIHLIGLIPHGQTGWRPPIEGAWSFGELLGHLFDCLAGTCAVLYMARTDELAHFGGLRDLPVNQSSEPAAAWARIELYRRHIQEGFAALRDSDLGRKLPTVFVAEGESVLTLLLGNLEHLTNHKYQLFLYLRLAGVRAGTPDLYRFR